jgi:hypothetical protein
VAGFGDDDPEDAWDEDDPRPTKLGILIRLLFSVALEHAQPGHNHDRVKARVAIGIWHTERLRQKQTRAEAPSLAALATAFALLDTLVGP